MRAASTGEDGDGDRSNNRAVLFLELRGGRVVRREDDEDTERVAMWGRERAADITPRHRGMAPT